MINTFFISFTFFIRSEKIAVFEKLTMFLRQSSESSSDVDIAKKKKNIKSNIKFRILDLIQITRDMSNMSIAKGASSSNSSTSQKHKKSAKLNGSDPEFCS